MRQRRELGGGQAGVLPGLAGEAERLGGGGPGGHETGENRGGGQGQDGGFQGLLHGQDHVRRLDQRGDGFAGRQAHGFGAFAGDGGGERLALRDLGGDLG